MLEGMKKYHCGVLFWQENGSISNFRELPQGQIILVLGALWIAIQ
jgi:hypothetical protein